MSANGGNRIASLLWIVYITAFFFLTIGILSVILVWDGSWSNVQNLRVSFYFMVLAVCILYINLAMTSLAFALDPINSYIYMMFVSVSFGVFFPAAAIDVLVTSIYLTIDRSVGFPAVYGIVAGALMLLFYFGLLLYDQYITIGRRKTALHGGPRVDDRQTWKIK